MPCSNAAGRNEGPWAADGRVTGTSSREGSRAVSCSRTGNKDVASSTGNKDVVHVYKYTIKAP